MVGWCRQVTKAYQAAGRKRLPPFFVSKTSGRAKQWWTDEPDRRGFEWHYLNRLARFGPLVSIETAPLRDFTLSPDRTRLIGITLAAAPQPGEPG
jgi:hypothetical protein